MKINAATIMGWCVLAAGALMIVLGWARGLSEPQLAADVGTADPQRASGLLFFWIGVGVSITGIIILLLGQRIKPSPKPTDEL